MCGGGGSSAESMYQEKKPEFGALPSLSMESPIERGGNQYGGVRTGAKRRSLLAPMMQAAKDQGAY